MTVEPLDRDLAEVVWWGTRTLRTRAHTARGLWRCPSRVVPYGPADPSARQLHERCREDGCLGIVHTVYAATTARLSRPGGDATPVVDRLKYARRVVASQVAELDRRARVGRGLPAKPTRTDGVPGRVRAALAEHGADPVRRLWLVALFRMISGYVCREHRAAALWPTDMWAAEKSALDGRLRGLGEAAGTEILADIQTVLGVARDVAGPEWVTVTILHPFLAVLGPLPEDIAEQGPADHDPAELAVLAAFRSRYAAWRGRGLEPEPAFRQACGQIYGCLPSGSSDELREAIEDLEALIAAS